jgi:preprotein translocase subunit SecD
MKHKCFKIHIVKTLLAAVVVCSVATAVIAGELSTAPVFQLRLVADTQSNDSEQMVLVTKRHSVAYTNVLNVQKNILLDQTAVKSAKPSKDALGHPIIDVTFTDDGSKRFAEVTRQNVGKRLAIIINGQLYEAPVIKTEIPGGKAQISGDFTEGEVKDLAKKIENALVQK